MERTESEKACKFSRVKLGHYVDEAGGAGQINRLNRQVATELLTGEQPARAGFVKRSRLIFKVLRLRGLFHWLKPVTGFEMVRGRVIRGAVTLDASLRRTSLLASFMPSSAPAARSI